MARDLVLLASIASFWFVIVFGFSLIASDETFQQLDISGNTTFVISEVNITFQTDTDETTISTFSVQRMGFWGAFSRIFTFRIPGIAGIPVFIGAIISFINYILLILIFLIGYRQLRSGAG